MWNLRRRLMLDYTIEQIAIFASVQRATSKIEQLEPFIRWGKFRNGPVTGGGGTQIDRF